MNKKELDLITKGLWNIVFRGGPIEYIHTDKTPIRQAEMETLNRYGINRLGFMLNLFMTGSQTDIDNFRKLCLGESLAVSEYDNPDLNSQDAISLADFIKSDDFKYLDVFLNQMKQRVGG